MNAIRTEKQRLTAELRVWTGALMNARTKETARDLANEVQKIKQQLLAVTK